MEDNIEKDVETVGEMLRNARLKSGKALSDVAEELCIRKAYLTAIEEMDFKHIPEDPYGSGFIKSYAKYLGLNSERIVSSYRQVELDNKDGKHVDKSDNVTASKPSFKHVLLGLLGLILLIGTWLFISKYKYFGEFSDSRNDIIAEVSDVTNEELSNPIENENEEKIDIVETEENAIDESQVDELQSEGLSEQSDDQQEDVVVQDQHIKFELIGPSWIELKQGDTVLLTGTYQRGFTYDIPNGENTFITVGRHHNVKFYLNDKPVSIISAMNKKNVKLDEYMKPQE